MDNPFNKNTMMYKDFEILKDGEWHCTKCDLQSGQAKTYQVMRLKHNIPFTESTPNRWARKLNCSKCERLTEHRQINIDSSNN